MAVLTGQKFDMISRLRVADYLTLSNAFCGALSIFCSMQQYFLAAHVFIFFGYEFDRYDGKVARWRNECSEMGKQLDSLSDLVTFGVAPAVMLYSIGFRTPADQAVLAFYVACGAARLARFNVAAHLIPKDANGKGLYIEGLPISFAALALSTVVAVSAWLGWATEVLLLTAFFPRTWVEFHPAVVLVLVLGSMMVSKRLRLTSEGALTVPAIYVATFASCWSFSKI